MRGRTSLFAGVATVLAVAMCVPSTPAHWRPRDLQARDARDELGVATVPRVSTLQAAMARARSCGPYPGDRVFTIKVIRGTVRCSTARRILVAAENRAQHLERIGSWWCFGPPLGANLSGWNERCGLTRRGITVASYRDFYGRARKFRDLIEI